MVSNPLLWPFLSSLVFIGVTPLSTSLPPSQQSPQPLAVEPPTSSSRCLRVPDLQPLLLRSPTPHRSLHVSSHHEYCSDHISGGITEIILKRSTWWWKPRSHWSRHAPSRAAWSSSVSAPRASRTILSSSLCHPWRHLRRVSPSCVSIQSSADISATSSWWRHLLTVDRVNCWPLTLTDCWPSVDYWLWPLNFLQGWLLQSKFSLPKFSCRFHFCNLFLHIVSK